VELSTSARTDMAKIRTNQPTSTSRNEKYVNDRTSSSIRLCCRVIHVDPLSKNLYLKMLPIFLVLIIYLGRLIVGCYLCGSSFTQCVI